MLFPGRTLEVLQYRMSPTHVWHMQPFLKEVLHPCPDVASPSWFGTGACCKRKLNPPGSRNRIDERHGRRNQRHTAVVFLRVPSPLCVSVGRARREAHAPNSLELSLGSSTAQYLHQRFRGPTPPLRATRGRNRKTAGCRKARR